MYVARATAGEGAGLAWTEAREETAPEGGQRKEPERAPAYNHPTSGVTGRPALVLDRPGGIPQGNGTCTHDPGPDVGEIRYGVPAGILAAQ